MEMFSILNNLDILIVWVHKAEGGDVGPRVFKLLHVHQMQVLGVIIITSGRITRVNAWWQTADTDDNIWRDGERNIIHK